MSEEEAAFLRGIVEDPRDETRRLVYADWLEERDDPESPRRAEYLRVECEIDRTPKSPERSRLLDRLKKLQKMLSVDWWRALDWSPLSYCVQFEYECPQSWDRLTLTGDENVRRCEQCEMPVRYARDVREVMTFADAGECVALDSRVLRVPLRSLRQNQNQGRLLGRLRPSRPRRIPLPMRGRDTGR